VSPPLTQAWYCDAIMLVDVKKDEECEWEPAREIHKMRTLWVYRYKSSARTTAETLMLALKMAWMGSEVNLRFMSVTSRDILLVLPMIWTRDEVELRSPCFRILFVGACLPCLNCDSAIPYLSYTLRIMYSSSVASRLSLTCTSLLSFAYYTVDWSQKRTFKDNQMR
jgi:hypothetical protein